MRFQVTQVMDAIEQRLTTDVTGAQAVVDLGEIVRNVELDQGRPVSLVRIGMVVDALSRYLVDGGAMLYGVVERTLLSDAALTSKERMVLGRWADDGLIEVTPSIGDRVLEIADITGLPLIAASDHQSGKASPYEGMAGRYRWLADGDGRVLSLCSRSGAAVLTPVGGASSGPDAAGAPAEPVIGRAKVPEKAVAEKPESLASVTEEADADQGEAEAGRTEATAAQGTEPEEVEAEEVEAEAKAAEGGAREQPTEKDKPEDNKAPADTKAPEDNKAPADTEIPADAGTTKDAAAEGDGGAEPEQAAGAAETVRPLGAVFTNRGIVAIARTRISWRRFLRAEPNSAHEPLLRRQWRCDEFECPVFGEHRRLGQPVPRLRAGVPTCPRHDEPVVDIGPRGPSYPVSIVVDDLPRRRLVVRGGRPLAVGRGTDDPEDPDGAGDDAELVSVAPWLHRAAAAWISPVHVRLEAGDDGLIVTDASDNGTVVWQREGPDDHGATRPLRGESYPLGEWDSVELYTGIELMRGDRRLAATLGRDELESVLLDAPTAAHHQVYAS